MMMPMVMARRIWGKHEKRVVAVARMMRMMKELKEEEQVFAEIGEVKSWV